LFCCFPFLRQRTSIKIFNGEERVEVRASLYRTGFTELEALLLTCVRMCLVRASFVTLDLAIIPINPSCNLYCTRPGGRASGSLRGIVNLRSLRIKPSSTLIMSRHHSPNLISYVLPPSWLNWLTPSIPILFIRRRRMCRIVSAAMLIAGGGVGRRSVIVWTFRSLPRQTKRRIEICLSYHAHFRLVVRSIVEVPRCSGDGVGCR
jgi:hypothetical protein